MDRESVERLRFDRRLARRRGWLEEGQLEAYLESLPDSSGNMTTIAEVEAESDEGGPAAGSATAAAEAPAQHAIGGGFANDPIGGGPVGSGGGASF